MTEEIIVVCPMCSPKEPVGHDILRPGQNPVVQCHECGAVHPTTIEEKKPVKTKVIVSKDDVSFTLHTSIDAGEMIYVDDELIVDDEEADEVYPIIVTSLEAGGRRVEREEIENVDVIWGRATDEVTAKISIKIRNGSTSVEKRVSGEFEFIVGEKYNAERKDFQITKIKIRGGGFQSRKGDRVPAKYIKRIFATEVRKKGWGEAKTSWSAKRNGRY